MGDLSRWGALTQAQRVLVGDGDSVTRGTAHGTNGWFAQLRVSLGEYFQGNPGLGTMPLYLQNALDPDDQRYTFADSLADFTVVTAHSVDDLSPYGLAYTRGAVTTTTQGIRYTKQTGETIHHFDLHYVDITGSGDLDVYIDGATTPVVVTTAKAGDHALKLVTVNRAVTSNIRIAPHGSTQMPPCWVATWSITLPPQGCALHNLGKDGSHVYEFDHVAGSGDPLAIHDLLAPDLATVLWTNDFTTADIGGTPTAVTVANLAAATTAYGAHLQAVYDDLNGLGCDVLFIVPYQQQRGIFGRTIADDETIQAAFRAKIIAVANANTHADYIDIYSQFPAHANDAITAGLINADGLHPTQTGHDLIHSLIYSKVAVGAARPPSIQVVVTPPSSSAILDGTYTGVRADTFLFELTSASRERIAYLNPFRSSVPTVTLDTTRRTFRTVEGFTAADKPADLDLRQHRLRVTIQLQNGDTFPVGVFMFGQNDNELDTGGDLWTPQLFDENFLLDQGLGRSWSIAKGASLLKFFAAMANEVLGPLDIPTSYSVSDQPAGAPLAFLVGSKRLDALNAVAGHLGCFPPFFANDGTHTLKQSGAPDGSGPVDHIYNGGPTSRIFRGSLQQSDTLYNAPNEYIVVGAQLGSGIPVRGVYDLPASAPHSFGQVGYRVTAPVHSVPAVTDPAIAAQIAYIDALIDPNQYRTAEYDATADPRHDTFGTVQFLTDRYLEKGWVLACEEGGNHHHQLAALWAA